MTNALPALDVTDRSAGSFAQHPTAADLAEVALAGGRIDWSAVPETGGIIRAQLQRADARIATRALMGAGIICVFRAALVAPLLGNIVVHLPPSERAQFAGYLDPLAVHVSLGLAVVFVAGAIVAGKRPLLASLVALAIFLVAAVPFVLRNPVLIGGGHLGRLGMLLILLRAGFAGLSHHAR